MNSCNDCAMISIIYLYDVVTCEKDVYIGWPYNIVTAVILAVV